MWSKKTASVFCYVAQVTCRKNMENAKILVVLLKSVECSMVLVI